jgi:hypothetical protein
MVDAGSYLVLYRQFSHVIIEIQCPQEGFKSILLRLKNGEQRPYFGIYISAMI